MKSFILVLSLLSITICDTTTDPKSVISDIYKGLKKKINKCIVNSNEVSAELKELATKNLNSGDSQFQSFLSLHLTEADRKVLRFCKKEAFRKKTGKENSEITPIGIENALHSKTRIPKQARQIRKLSAIEQVKRLGAFNIGGIFPCIENAQPAIKVIRDSINLIRNMDYTSAIINIYDNFKIISEGLSFCINSILPA